MTSAGDDWRQTFRPDIPSPARMYNYFLGGKDHYEADRKAAEQVIAAIPEVLVFARENRAFLRRAVRYLVAECGIRQIIDIGTGLPSEGNVHEVAQALDPGVRVVYVDHDPVVLAHGRNMLSGIPGTVIIGRDLLEPASILTDADLLGLIDFSEPVAVLLVAVAHFIDDDDRPADLIRALVRPLAPGSYLVLSHATSDSRPQEARAVERIYRATTTNIHARTRSEVLALVPGGLELIEPGLVWAPLWRPELGAVTASYPAASGPAASGPATDDPAASVPATDDPAASVPATDDPAAANVYAVVARKP